MTDKWNRTFLMSDERGLMGVVEEEQVPFDIKRVFWLSNVPPGETRGEHAHRRCRQFIICARGSATCTIETAHEAATSRMLSAGDTCDLDKMTWVTLSQFSKDSLIIVLASESYDETDYIHNYEDFKSENFNRVHTD
jgi:hypothetical protein